MLYFIRIGQCLSKQGVGSACSSYGVISCQEWLNLTCSFGPINNYLNCYCYSGYYWDNLGTDSGSIGCLPMGQVESYVCEGTYKNYACNTNASLTCNSASRCQCILIFLIFKLKKLNLIKGYFNNKIKLR